MTTCRTSRPSRYGPRGRCDDRPSGKLRFARAHGIAQVETQRHLGLIERQIAARAERLTITDRAKRRHQTYGASSWTKADERVFQEHLAELTLARRGEIDALTRKLDRQENAIAEFQSRHHVSAAHG